MESLLKFFKIPGMSNRELRVLRYNDSNNSELKESKKICSAIEELKNSDLKFKYQVSAGSDISAACGQFICRRNG
jgi:adenine C2-methylase RlmN of 23S rRNA A2503 and tRNA A37